MRRCAWMTRLSCWGVDDACHRAGRRWQPMSMSTSRTWMRLIKKALKRAEQFRYSRRSRSRTKTSEGQSKTPVERRGGSRRRSARQLSNPPEWEYDRNSTSPQFRALCGHRYRNAPRMIEWLCRVFGFERHAVYPGPNETIAPCPTLTLGGGMIFVASFHDSESQTPAEAA